MSLRHELRWAVRSITRNGAFTLLVIGTFAIGIALNLVVAALVDSLLFQPAPGTRNPNAVAVLGMSDSQPGVLSYRDVVDFREQNRTLLRLAAWKGVAARVQIGADAPRVRAMLVSAGYFEALGVQPARGRFIAADEDRVPNEAAVVVLTDSFWRTRLGGADVLGQDLVINNRPFRIIGIAPPAFRGTAVIDQPEVFVPMMMQPLLMASSGNLLEKRGWSGVYAVAELRPGVTSEQAQADLATIAARLEKAYPGSNQGRGVTLLPLSRVALPPSARPVAARSAAVLAVVSFGALCLICANVANLFVGRAIGRSREIVVRSILGAGRWGVARQIAMESILLSTTGAVAGIGLAALVVTALRGRVPELAAATVTPTTALLTPLLAILAGLACAIVPMFAASAPSVPKVLRGPTGMTSRGTHRVTSVLVAVQVAVSVVLLTATALLALSLMKLGEVSLGFDTSNVLVTEELSVTASDDPGKVRGTYETVLTRIRALPWIESASLGSLVPLTGGGDQTQMYPEGASRDQRTSVAFYVVAPDYFRTLGIAIRRGREFTAADSPSSPRVCVINETLARRFWPNGNAVGSQVRLVGEGTLEVVGIAGDIRFANVRNEAPPTVYFPHAQAGAFDVAASMTLFVRTERDPVLAARDLQPVLASAGVPVGGVGSLESIRRNATGQERILSMLIGFVAALALAISALGLYGVLALSVAERTREIGVRMALGATPASVVRRTMIRGALLALAGVVAGSAVIIAGRALLAPLLFGTHVTDPMVWTGVLASVALSVIAATYLPARRAAGVDPAIALREQ